MKFNIRKHKNYSWVVVIENTIETFRIYMDFTGIDKNDTVMNSLIVDGVDTLA